MGHINPLDKWLTGFCQPAHLQHGAPHVLIGPQTTPIGGMLCRSPGLWHRRHGAAASAEPICAPSPFWLPAIGHCRGALLLGAFLSSRRLQTPAWLRRGRFAHPDCTAGEVPQAAGGGAADARFLLLVHLAHPPDCAAHLRAGECVHKLRLRACALLDGAPPSAKQ